jgi:anthranilate synthase component 2
MPKQLTMTAQVSLQHNNEEIILPMAIEHSTDAAIGFQFHPESILTTFGTNLLAQSLRHLSALANKTLYKKDENAHENH